MCVQNMGPNGHKGQGSANHGVPVPIWFPLLYELSFAQDNHNKETNLKIIIERTN